MQTLEGIETCPTHKPTSCLWDRGVADSDLLAVHVDSVTDETGTIRSFRLVPAGGEALPPYKAGAHVDVYLKNGMVRQYSLTGDPIDKTAYNIAVLNLTDSRGGSASVHSDIGEGDMISISPPRNNFPLNESAPTSVLIAGGIGITPILSMAYRLHELGRDFELHYCSLSPEKTAFYDLLLSGPFARRVRFYHDEDSPDDRLQIDPLLKSISDTTPIYCCGPEGLLQALLTKGEELGKNIRFERFSAILHDSSSSEGLDEFEVELADTGVILHVGAEDSILDVLLDNDIEIEFKCEEGLCGTCFVDVIDGIPDHRDSIMNASEHAANTRMATCCSRSATPRLKIRVPKKGPI